MSWHHLADSLSWSPGHSGSGYLLHDGVIKTWNVDPFHPLDQHSVHEQNHEFSPIALKFDIDPDGGIVTLQPTPKAETIVLADPRLYNAGQRPVFEDTFSLDHYKPTEDETGKPDMNFIMSRWDWSEKPHRNRWTGQLCQCGWGSKHLQHKLRRLAGVQMRRLLKAPDKAYKTPEGQQFIEHLSTLPEDYDSLFPYLAHRFKKGDVRFNPEPGDERPDWQKERDRQMGNPYTPPGPRLERRDTLRGDPYWCSILDELPNWHQWFEARDHPTRRGVNVMDPDFTPSMMVLKTAEHRRALQEARRRENWISQYATYAPEPAHVFGPEAGKYRGWQVIPLDGEQAAGDSEALGHCIGSSDQPYRSNIENGIIDAYSLRDREGYPHASWHFNPGGQDIGHMQGQGGYPNNEYRKLMSMFHEQAGLPDEEGLEERLEDPDLEDPDFTFPEARDVDDYIRFHHPDRHLDYANDNANIGDDTELYWEEPNWTRVARDYLDYPNSNGNADDFHYALNHNEAGNDAHLDSMFAALQDQYDPDDETHREAASVWNEQVPSRYELALPPPAPIGVDEYNEQVAQGYDPSPDDWDPIAQDYLDNPEYYAKEPAIGASPYRTFHTHINARNHDAAMYGALQSNIDWEDELHPQAAQHWNYAHPTTNLYLQPDPPPDQRPGQLGWDWPRSWMADDQDTSDFDWDRSQYAVSNDERYYPRQGAVDELHVALAIPAPVITRIHTWVKAQDWPEDTKLEDPDDYHITLLYAPDGHEEHRDADWLTHSDGFSVEVTDVDEFGGDDGDPAIVLRITSPEVKGLADAMQSEAENHELEISKFPGGYKPHITVAYGPGKPKHCQAPDLKFKTGPSSVSTPRESAWHFGDGPYGYTNSDTSEVALTIDNDSALAEASRQLVEQGATPQQLRDWAIRKIISPHNRQQMKDAQEWNAIPLEERKRRQRQHDIDSFGEDAVNIGEGLMQPFTDWNNEGKDEDEIRREEEYDAPDLIDPELVNWDELHQGILDEFDENAEYERQQQRNRDSGVGWASNGGDAQDKMRDAFYRYHGALPEEEIQAELGPGYHSSDPRHYHNRNVNIPFEHMEQLSNWPEHYSLGRDGLWKHRYQQAEQKAREELLSRGIAPEKVEGILDDRSPFAPDYVKKHFPGGKYDTPIDLKDPEERAVFLSDPKVQAIQQHGYNMRLHDLYSDLSHAISYGQPHPHTPQMTEALQQRGYTPEQIQSMMAPQWQWDEIARQRIPVNAPVPVEQWAQQAEEQRRLDQPGDLTIPEDWSRSSKLADADHMLAPAIELREWLADLSGDDPAPSIHHDSEDDLIHPPAVSTADDLPYYPPSAVPSEMRASTVRYNSYNAPQQATPRSSSRKRSRLRRDARRRRALVSGFRAAEPEEWLQAFDAAIRDHPQAAYVTRPSPEELAARQRFLSADSYAGYTVTPEAEVANAFNHPEGPRGLAQALMTHAGESGDWCQCFDGGLADLYRHHGMTVQARLPFSRAQAPANWNYERDGEPDVVFMAYGVPERNDNYVNTWEEAVAAARAPTQRIAYSAHSQDQDDPYCPQCNSPVEYRPAESFLNVSHWWCPTCHRDPLYDQYTGNLSGIPEIDKTIYQGFQSTWRPRDQVARERAQTDDLLDFLNGQADLGDNEHLGKVSAMTAQQRFRLAQELAQQYGPDTSRVVHSFPDGWTMRQLQTYADAQREGHLMRNCFAHNTTESPNQVWHQHPQVRRSDNFLHDNGHDFSAVTDYDQPLPDDNEYGRLYSLRDPDNLPHVSVDPNINVPALGQHNRPPHVKYRPYLAQWGQSSDYSDIYDWASDLNNPMGSDQQWEGEIKPWQREPTMQLDPRVEQRLRDALSQVKTADSPINQADATNDPLAKNPAIIPDRKGDPDYLQASICPNCQQIHRPDEPCPESSVTQYKQMERSWYNRDPNSLHSAPDGLSDHQMDLGKVGSSAQRPSSRD